MLYLGEPVPTLLAVDFPEESLRLYAFSMDQERVADLYLDIALVDL